MASWWEDDTDSGRGSGSSSVTYTKKAPASDPVKLPLGVLAASSSYGRSSAAGRAAGVPGASLLSLAPVGTSSTAAAHALAPSAARSNAIDDDAESTRGVSSRGRGKKGANKSVRGIEDENSVAVTSDAAPPTPTSERTVTRSEISDGSWWSHVISDALSTARTASTRKRPMIKARIAASVACRASEAHAAASVVVAVDEDAPLQALDATAADTQSSMQAHFRRVSRAVSAHVRMSIARVSHVSTRVHGRKRVSDAFLPPLDDIGEEEQDDDVIHGPVTTRVSLANEVAAASATSEAAAPVSIDRVLAHVCEFMDTPSLSRIAVTSRSFRDASVTARCFRVAHTLEAEGEDAHSTVGPRNVTPFLMTFPWGRFIAQGGYKTVYEVWNDARGVLEAVSIMNLTRLRSSGAFHLVCAEIAQSCIASTLAHTRVCPHFVLIHDVLVLQYDPAEVWPFLWATKESCPFVGDTEPRTRVRAVLDAAPSRRGGAARTQAGKLPSWASGTVTSFQRLKKTLDAGATCEPFLLMRMDMCEDGDLEAYLRQIEPQVAAVEAELAAAEAAVSSTAASSALLTLRGARSKKDPTAASAPRQRLSAATEALHACDTACAHAASVYTLQLCTALFAVRTHMWALHRDVKALNALCRKANGTVSMAFGTQRFRYTLASESPFTPRHMLKLTDFGTCVTGMDRASSSASLSVAMDQWCFTTVENVPPEYFLYGDQALCSPAVDTWALGLTLLHMLTGDAPYEEWMAACIPPPAFVAAVTRAWTSHTRARGGKKQHKHSYETCVGIATECGWEVLTHTLYRQLVLLGATEGGAFAWTCFAATPAMHAVQAVLMDATQTRAFADLDCTSARRVYKEHTGLYGLAAGTHACVKRIRRRLQTWGAGWTLLRDLLQPDPEARPAMRACILSPAFAHLRAPPGGSSGHASGEDVYDAFARSSDDALPCM